MAEYRLSEDASVDLDNIADYTIEMFGLDQARRYGRSFVEAFARIASFPDVGSDCGRIQPGALRFVHRSHVIYYRKISGDILILRILGADQDPARHL